MKKKKLVFALIVIVVIALVAVVVIKKPSIGPMAAMNAAISTGSSTYTVGRGDVCVTITGSGKLEALDSIDVDLPEGIKIDTIFVSEGDVVEKGDVLSSFDTASLQYRAAELSSELTDLDGQLGTLKTKSTIKAPVSGRIKYQPVAEDDDIIETVNEYGALAILSTDGLMQITLKTNASLSLNTEVTVKWNGGSADGKVASRVDGGYLITLDDEKAPYLATADIYYDSAKIGSGTLEIHAPLAIFGNGGTIATIHYSVDTKVSSGTTLFTLDNEPATDTYRQTLADRNEKAEQLQIILQYQNNPNVIAPCAGTINTVSIDEGKKTTSSDDTGMMTAFTLGTGGAVKMTVDVDELDIGKVQMGQSAEVTLDAFAGETFSGTVTRISHIGKASGSITVYATDLILNADSRLMDGMNGTSIIQSDSVQDALVIPLGAIHEDETGAYVYRLDATDTQSIVYVTTGLSDGTNAEVTSGLNEGDRIVYTASVSASQAQPTMMMPGQMLFGGGQQ